MSKNASTPQHSHYRSFLSIGVLLIAIALLLAVFRLNRSAHSKQSTPISISPVASNASPQSIPQPVKRVGMRDAQTREVNPPSPEEQVSAALRTFAESRRVALEHFANRLGISAPTEFQEFFDAVAANRWEDIDRIYTQLSERRHQDDSPKEYTSLWPVIHETLGVAEVVHEWPAQQLLDYGHFVLGSLPPGAVYVGGTDEGRFIPTLLNASAEEPRVVFTQNSLADATYMEYLRFLYDPVLKLPNEDQVQAAFTEIVKSHGKATPDGRMEVSGQNAVMAINGLLLQQMSKDNPDRSFAVQESFPLKNTYPNATLTGPVYLYGTGPTATDGATTASTPAETVALWQQTVNQFQSKGGSEPTTESRAAYAKLATGQANLLVSQGKSMEAEQTFRLAVQLSPGLPDATFPLVELLLNSGRKSEALVAVDAAIAHVQQNPSRSSNPLEGYRQLRSKLTEPNP